MIRKADKKVAIKSIFKLVTRQRKSDTTSVEWAVCMCASEGTFLVKVTLDALSCDPTVNPG